MPVSDSILIVHSEDDITVSKLTALLMDAFNGHAFKPVSKSEGATHLAVEFWSKAEDRPERMQAMDYFARGALSALNSR